MASSKSHKRQKSGDWDQLSNVTNKLQDVTNKLQALNTVLASSSQLSTTWLTEVLGDHIKPGLGLLGTKSEELELQQELSAERRHDSDEAGDSEIVVDTEAVVDSDVAVAREQNDNTNSDSVFGKSQNTAQPTQKAVDVTASVADIEGIDGQLAFGSDFVELGDGAHVSLGEYFGPEWVSKITDLYDVPAIPQPPYMTTEPHPWQLKGAAQADHACRSVFRAFVCGDRMGVGKTMLALLAAWMVRDEPGFTLVVAPKSVCPQWKKEVEGHWESGHQMRAFILDDPKITASQLLSAAYDIVITSYEFAEASFRSIRDFPDAIDKYAAGSGLKPTRPTSALYSTLWRSLKLPIKRLVLDECQRVNKRHGARHIAIKELYYEAVIMLSGTFLHNKWQDISGLVDFVNGHPFNTHRKFCRAFSTVNYKGVPEQPDEVKTRLLQRFLQAFTIARPSTVLELPEAVFYRDLFQLSDDEAALVLHHTGGAKVNKEEKNCLAHAIRAQLCSLHPALLTEVGEYSDSSSDEDDEGDYGQRVGKERYTENRDAWLSRVRDEIDVNSTRVERFIQLFVWLRDTYPDEKIVVFSNYLKFLDILSKGLKERLQIEALRFDGTVNQTDRQMVRQRFDEAHPSVPLLITAGAGGVGLNITAASIVMQTEIWWNRNSELQAVHRAWRPGQDRQVKVIGLQAENSLIDGLIRKAQRGKTNINERLMKRLVRRHDEGPDIPTIPQSYGLAPLEYEMPDLPNWEAFVRSNAQTLHPVLEENGMMDVDSVAEEDATMDDAVAAVNVAVAENADE